MLGSTYCEDVATLHRFDGDEIATKPERSTKETCLKSNTHESSEHGNFTVSATKKTGSVFDVESGIFKCKKLVMEADDRGELGTDRT